LLLLGCCTLAPVGCSDNDIKAIERIAQNAGAAGAWSDAGAGQAGTGAGQVDAGKGGQSSQGGSAGSGLTAGGGNGGVAGAGGTGATVDSGVDGDSGASALDCAAQCGGDYCQGQAPGADCSQCLYISLCGEAEATLAQAPNALDYETCIATCSDASCLDNCCSQYAQACWAVALEHQCACGYPTTSCKADCADACTGVLSAACEACERTSPCGVALYGYDYTTDTAGRGCIDGCAGQQTCVLMCCPQYPVACAAYQLAANCACQN
jgi:hypothetical protein